MAFTEKYVTVTGGGLHDGSSEANAWTLAESHTNAVAGERLNIKAGTYTNSSILNSWPSATNSSPFSMRGYKSTIGDLDDKPTSQLVDGTDRPLIDSVSSNYLLFNLSYYLIENISFKSSTNRPALYSDGSKHVYNRCKFIADSGATLDFTPCVRVANNSHSVFYLCHFDGNGGYRTQSIDKSRQFIGCLFEELKTIQATEFAFFQNSVFRDFSSNCLSLGPYGFHNIHGNTFYDISGNAIEIRTGSTPSIGSFLIHNNIFHSVGGNALHSVGNYFDFFADNNLFYNITGSNYSNTFNLNRNAISESSDPFVDAAGGDYSLVSSSGGYGKAQPNPFEGLAADSRRDVGALQHADPSGGGGGAVLHPLRSN